MGLQVWSTICLPGEIKLCLTWSRSELCVSQQKRFHSSKWFWKKPRLTYQLLLAASGPHFMFREAYCLTPYQAFCVCDCQSFQEHPVLSFANILQKHQTFHFKTLQLSALYISIYLFKTDCVRWEMTCQKHRWGKLMVFIPFIFYILCTLIYTVANIQSRWCFTQLWFAKKSSIVLNFPREA